MYPNLRAEMARQNIKGNDIASLLNVTKNTASWKLRGKTDFTRSEIFKIKDGLFPNLSLEYLFTSEEKQCN